MKFFKETTGQVGDFRYPAHVYAINTKSGKLVGYIPEGQTELRHLTPMKFDKRRRTFTEVYP